MDTYERRKLVSLLLPDAPISSSVYERGFYFDEDGLLCYRHSATEFIKTHFLDPLWLLFAIFFLIIWTFHFSMKVEFPVVVRLSYSLSGVLLIGLLWALCIYLYMYFAVFYPWARYDLTEKIILDYRNYVIEHDTFFSAVRCFVIYQGLAMMRSNTVVVAVINAEHSLFKINVYFYKNKNEQYVNEFVGNIRRLIGDSVPLVKVSGIAEFRELRRSWDIRRRLR